MYLAAVTLFLSVIKAVSVLQKLVSLVEGAECGQRSKRKTCEDTTLRVNGVADCPAPQRVRLLGVFSS